jgi:radical SAM superfamily enzyme YgiQ (UPF0313 family)
VAGCLEQHGVEVQLLDVNAENLSLEETTAKLKEFGPDFVGYTITTYLFYQTLAWVKAIREAVDVPTIAGGVHMGMYPIESMTHGCLDYGVTGEAEMTLPELLFRVTNKRSLEGLKGLVYKNEEGEVIYNGDAGLLANVSEAAWPALHLVDNSLYFSFISKYKNFGCMMTSRGCPYRCIFCEQGGLKFRPRTPKDVVDEMEFGRKEHGIREYDFFDSAFTIQKPRVIEISKEIVRRKLDIVWAARTRVDCISREMLDWMARAGCVRIYYGLESGNRRILKILLKAADLEQAKATVKDTKDAGIDVFGYFMIGNPGEDRATVRQTIRYALSMEMDYAQFSKVTPMPGTQLYDMYLEEFGEDYWREFILNEDYDSYIPRPDCALSEEEIQELVQLAYVRFYYRPMFAARTLARMKSVDEFKRSVSTAWQMLVQKPEGQFQDMDLS